jgi:GGDEF domain-containing protein
VIADPRTIGAALAIAATALWLPGHVATLLGAAWAGLGVARWGRGGAFLAAPGLGWWLGGMPGWIAGLCAAGVWVVGRKRPWLRLAQQCASGSAGQTIRDTLRHAQGADAEVRDALVTAVEQHHTAVTTAQARSVADELTGLRTAAEWRRRLDEAIADARRRSLIVVVVVADADGLGAINAQTGRQAGDAVLVRMATAMGGCVAGRLGGDEFAALADDPTTARALADAVRRCGPATCGLAVWAPGESQADLLARADRALYAGKRTGGGCVVEAP